MNILAVEDDAVARAVLRQALRRLGHEVVEAADGEAAWELLQKGDGVRVVVSDWMMPRSDGLDLCRRIRKRVNAEYIYFILLTSRDATEENQTTVADAGVDDFLTKPLDLSELWTRLRVAERILRYTTQVRQLEEMLPICSYCKKIRDDQNYWQQLEGYISERTGSDFSHSVCPDCYQRVLVPELAKIKASASAPKPHLSLNESIRHLEEKIAYLERHVTEQDKAMLEFAEELAAVRRELKALRDRSGSDGGSSAREGEEAPDERPPHY